MSEKDYQFGWIVFVGTVFLLFAFTHAQGALFFLTSSLAWLIFRAEKIRNIFNPWGFQLAGVLFCLLLLSDYYSPSTDLSSISLAFFSVYLACSLFDLNPDTKGELGNKTAIILITTFVLIGYFIRIYGYDCLPAYRDEEHHVGAVYSLIAKDNVVYVRSLLTTMLGKFFLTEDVNAYFEFLWAGRKASIVSGILTTIPIYFIGKRLGKSVGIVSAFLWVVSPWAIGISQIFREYIHYTFLCALGIWFIVAFLETLFNSNSRTPKDTLVLILVPLFLVTTFYFLVIQDVRSTFKVVPFVWFIFGTCYLLTSANTLSKRNLVMGIVAVAIVGVTIFLNTKYITNFLAFQIDISKKWTETFFATKPIRRVPFHWWTNNATPLLLPFFIIVSGLLYAIKMKKTKAYSTIAGTFFAVIIGFAIAFLRYFSAKYLFYVMPLFCILIATGYLGIIQFATVQSSKLIKSLSVFVALTSVVILWNPNKSLQGVVEPYVDEKSWNPIIGVLHLDKYPVLNHIDSTYTRQDLNDMVLITNFYEHIIGMERPDFKSIIKYNHASPLRFKILRSQIRQFKTGLLVIDQKRNTGGRKNFPAEFGKSFLIDDSVFTMTFKDDINHVYSWRKLEPHEPAPDKFDYASVIEKERARKEKRKKNMAKKKAERGWIGKYSGEYGF